MNNNSRFETNRKHLTASLIVAGVMAAPMLLGSTYTHNLMPVSAVEAAEHGGHAGQGGQGAGGAMKGEGGHGGVGGGNRTTDVGDILRGHGRDSLSGSGRPDDKGPPEGEGPSTDMGGG